MRAEVQRKGENGVEPVDFNSFYSYVGPTTDDDVSPEGSGDASITPTRGEFYWLSPFVVIRHRCWAEDNGARSGQPRWPNALEDLCSLFSPGRLIHHLPEKCRGEGNSCSLRQWLLYPLMFEPRGEKLMRPRQWAVTDRLSPIHYHNRSTEPLAVFLQRLEANLWDSIHTSTNVNTDD